MKHICTFVAVPVVACGFAVAGAVQASAYQIDPEERTNRLQLISADAQGKASTAVGPVFRSGVSADGRYVTFSTPGLLTSGDSGILADVFRLDRTTGSLVWITRAQDQTDPFGGRIGSVGPAISADGQHVAFESDDKQLAPGGGMFGRDTYLWNAARPR